MPRISTEHVADMQTDLLLLEAGLTTISGAQSSAKIDHSRAVDMPKSDLSATTAHSSVHDLPKGSTAKEDASPIYVEFEEKDSRDPMQKSRAHKWLITLAACGCTGLAASAGGSIGSGFPSMMRDLNCTREQAAISLGLYCLGFGIAPLVTASLSEDFGRQPLYIVSSIVFTLMHLMAALAQNVSTVIVARVIAGISGSTGATLVDFAIFVPESWLRLGVMQVGGTIADIWPRPERGLPMSVFSLTALSSTGLGPVIAGWIEQNPHLEWRWIQWLHLIVSAAYVLVISSVLVETRSDVILTRKARNLRKKTGDSRYRARAEDDASSLREALFVSFTRPIYLLITEPVVISFSLWLGLAWGVLYGQLECIPLIFKTLHNFSDGKAGLAFLPIVIGGVLGFLSNFYQERLYAKNAPRIGPEARLYTAMAAAILFVAGCFIYAWTAIPGVHWIGPMIGILVFTFSLYHIYLATFSYLADSYFIYASSALAGQSLFRNLMATVFPLFSEQMYTKLTFHWATTLFGCVAVVLALVPFILFLYGPQIRAKSRFAKKLAEKH